MQTTGVEYINNLNPPGSTVAGRINDIKSNNRQPDSSHIRRRNFIQKIMFAIFRCAAMINGIALLIILYFMVSNGWRAITWTFLTQAPRDSMTKGGILPCIIGTLALSLGAIIVAFPIGLASAIYLNEYARPGTVLRIIRLGINNLAGVPSVVFRPLRPGLFLLSI